MSDPNLIDDLERAALEVDCVCAAGDECSKKKLAARLRGHAETMRVINQLAEQVATIGPSPASTPETTPAMTAEERKFFPPATFSSTSETQTCATCGATPATYECGAGHVFCRPCARGDCPICKPPIAPSPAPTPALPPEVQCLACLDSGYVAKPGEQAHDCPDCLNPTPGRTP